MSYTQLNKVKYIVSWFNKTEEGPKGPFSRTFKEGRYEDSQNWITELQKGGIAVSIEFKTIEKIPNGGEV